MGRDDGGRDAVHSFQWKDLGQHAPVILLGLGLVVAGILLLNLTSNLTFIADEWNLLLLRQGWGLDQILLPFNGHPVMAPAFVFKALQDLFGMDSAVPMHVVATGTFLLVNVLLFVYVRRRVGPWAALIGTFLILFLGAAFEDLLFSFQIVYFGSLAAGMGALVALDWDDRKGDIAASILLAGSLTFSGLGLAFVGAAVAEWALNPRDRKRRLFVPGAAILFYVLWWIGWGHQTTPESLNPTIELSVVPKIPGFVFDSFAAALVSLAGLATGDGSEPSQPHLIWGKLAAVVLIGLAIWRLRKLERVPRAFLVTAAGGLCLYLLFALAQDAYIAYGPQEVRAATSSRYQLPTALFVVLVAANLLEGIRIRPLALGIAGVLSVFAISGGIQLMTSRQEERWEPAAVYTKASLAGIELASPDIPAGYTFRPGTSFDVPIDDYTKAVEAHGSPAFAPEELLDLETPFRNTADAAHVSALAITVSGDPPAFARPVCKQGSTAEPLELRPGNYAVRNGGNSDLGLAVARIGDPPGVQLTSVLPLAEAGLELPRGSLEKPWLLSFSGEGPVKVCTGEGSAG